jgi:hypothetical protein
MDTAYLSAFAALAGSLIGGLTSLSATWLSQYAQSRAQRYADDLHLRQDLYKVFIEEASKLYADAWQSSQPQVSDLVHLYALISRMRVLSSSQVVDSADQIGRKIIEQYRASNRSLLEIDEVVDDASLNPLRDFSNACREELNRLGGRPDLLD